MLTGIAIVALAGCGGDGAEAPEPEEQVAAQEPAATSDDPAAESLQQAAQSLQQLTAGSADPVPFEDLMEVLTEVSGWTQSNHRGHQINLPVRQSSVEARYEQGDVRVDVTVIDTALSQILLAPYSMFLASGFEERSSDGFKRSMTFEGSPGFEDWSSTSTRSEVVLLVGKRFIVTGSSHTAPNIDSVKEVLGGAVDLATLAGMQ